MAGSSLGIPITLSDDDTPGNDFPGPKLQSATVIVDRDDDLRHIAKTPSSAVGLRLPNSMSGLRHLNASCQAWLNDTAIEKANQFLYDGLPRALRDMINMENCPGSLLFDGVGEMSYYWTTGTNTAKSAKDLAFEAWVNGMVRKSPHPRRPYGGLVDKIRRRPWTVWPLVINKNHWILIVIKLQTQGPRQESIHNKWVEMPAEYHQNVEQVAIVDPMHSHQGPVVTAVWNRLVRFLIAGGLTFSRPEFGHPLRHVWVPPQRDGTSCGPRQYTVVRQFFQRLLVIYEADPTSVPYHDSLWQPMSGYFDDVHIRLEMAGFNAAQAVVDSDYHNRVAVELISKYTDGRNAKEGFNLPTGQPQLVKVPAEERRQFRDAETGGMSLEAPEVGPKLPVIPQNNIGLTQIPCPFAGAWTDDWGVTDTGNPIWADDSMDTSHG